ncbi:MAG: hypothetical protein ACYDBJ_09970 [Aggregatilineales bacterium]
MFDRFASDEPPDVPDAKWDTLDALESRRVPPDALDDEPDFPLTELNDLLPADDDYLPGEWADLTGTADDPPLDYEPERDGQPVFSAVSAAPTLTLPGFGEAENDQIEAVAIETQDIEEVGWAVVQTARFFGQELSDGGQPIYTVNALNIADTNTGLSAAILRIAQFDNLERAQDFYVELQVQVGRELSADEVGMLAESIASPLAHTAWQPIPIEDAYSIVEEMEAFDQDNPPADLDLRPVMAGPEQVVYEPCAGSPENGQSGVFIGRFLMDGRHPEPLRTDYRLIGTYDSHAANEVVYGLQAIQSEMRALLDEDVSRADQAMLSAARDIAVDNGLIASDGHLFDGLPFDDRIPLDQLLQSLPITPDFTGQAVPERGVPEAQHVGFALDLG